MPTYEKEDAALFLSIKKEIDELVDQEIILLSKTPQKIDRKTLEEKNSKAFFGQLQGKLEIFLTKSAPFFDELQKDLPVIYSKLKNAPKLKLPENPTYDTLQAIRKAYKDFLSTEELKQIREIGEKRFAESQFDKAHLYFLFLSVADPKNPSIWLIKGLIEQNLKSYQEALASYYVTILLDRTLLLAYLQMAECLILSQNIEGARRLFASIQSLDRAELAHSSFYIAKIEAIERVLTKQRTVA